MDKRYLARYYPDGNFNHALDFEFFGGDNHVRSWSIAHIGGGRDLPPEAVRHIEPELTKALLNFKNRLLGRRLLPCSVEIFKEYTDE